MTPEEKRRMADAADAWSRNLAMLTEFTRRERGEKFVVKSDAIEADKYRRFATTLRGEAEFEEWKLAATAALSRKADEMEAKQEPPPLAKCCGKSPICESAALDPASPNAPTTRWVICCGRGACENSIIGDSLNAVARAWNALVAP